jgi:hypothetical protein
MLNLFINVCNVNLWAIGLNILVKRQMGNSLPVKFSSDNSAYEIQLII